MKAQIEQAARDNHIAKLNQRMDLVKQGVASFKNKDFKSALQYYNLYLMLLTKSKGGGDITPKSFDPAKDAAEMLMLTGVYWDLAKIYDKMPGKESSKLKYFLNKFVIFSKGMAYQPLSQEMIRKFLTNDHPVKRAMFKESYVQLGGGRCFVATAVEEYCEPNTLTILRRYRDEVLLKSVGGRGLVKLYYGIGPFVAIRLIRSSERHQIRTAKFLGKIANAISCRFFPDGK